MKPSRLLREAKQGKLATVFKLSIPHPAIVDMCGLAGFSAVWLCNEHGPNDWNDLAYCVRAARNFDMDVSLRVSKGSYSDYLKPIEIDAAGIMVPLPRRRRPGGSWTPVGHSPWATGLWTGATRTETIVSFRWGICPPFE